MPPSVGNVVTYSISVANAGNVTLSTLLLADTLTDAAGGAQALNAAPAFASGHNGDGVLQVNETWIYTAAVTRTQSMIDAGGLSNTVTASGTAPSGAAVSDISDNDGIGTSDPTVTNFDRSSAIAVVKTATLNDGGDGRADIGDTISYAYVVLNVGNTTLFDVGLLETGFTGAGPAPVPVLTAGGANLDGDADAPDLSVGTTATFGATYTIAQADVDAGSVTNQATASAVDPTGTAVDNASGATTGDDVPTVTPLGAAPRLLVLKIADVSGLSVPAAVGDIVGYTITVENMGNVTISVLTLADTITDANGAAQALDATPTLTRGDDGDGLLQIDETWSYSAQVTLAQSMIDAGGLSNTVTVSGQTPGGDPVSDVSDDDGTGASDPTVTTLDRVPAIALVKTATLDDGGDRRADVGDTITYGYVVSNAGNTTVFDIGLVETGFTGAGVTPVPLLTEGGADLDGDADAPDLVVGGAATYSVVYALVQADLDAGAVTNHATGSAVDPNGAGVADLSGGTVGDDVPTMTPPDAAPRLLVLKTATVIGLSVPPVVGDILSYTITAENTGNVTISTFALVDSYTYLHDMYGQRIDGADDPSPRQHSHVFSIDATYDVTPQWTLGGKLGFRIAQSSPDATLPLVDNDAGLAVLNARYHLTHEWDLLLEGRYSEARQTGITETGILATAYRHFGPNVMLGLGYNFGNVSDDLTDLTIDDQGVFLNLITQF